MSSPLQSKANWIVIGTVLLMAYLLIFRWRTNSQLELHQTALIAGIEDNRWGPCKKRISENYKDRWGWRRDDLKLVFQDIRSQFLVLGPPPERRQMGCRRKQSHANYPYPRRRHAIRYRLFHSNHDQPRNRADGFHVGERILATVVLEAC